MKISVYEDNERLTDCEFSRFAPTSTKNTTVLCRHIPLSASSEMYPWSVIGRLHFEKATGQLEKDPRPSCSLRGGMRTSWLVNMF